ncbi:MAG TPA: biopolymer transporter ExbD [Planctomycetota bacterium]|nr:biopolymer transporter ExbD [Planctomycetota bacterium]
MNFRRATAQEEGFQIAPLIDMVFILLVYYVCTTAMGQLERQMDLDLPTAEKGTVWRQRTPYFINITKQGGVLISNRVMTDDDLRTWLKDLHDAYGAAPPPVVIRADRDTAFQHFVKVLDACAAADIRNVAYASIEGPRRSP